MELDNVLFEDDNIIVCKKNANIAVETARIGQKDMVSDIRTYLKAKTGSAYLGVVHRLDQPVEGVIVFGKTKAAAANLSKQITSHSVLKKYLAVVSGNVAPQQGTLVDYLIKDSMTNTSKVVSKDTPEGKMCSLSYKALENKEDKTLVEINLDTGRHHQIRVQMANMGHPLWGDTKYNPDFLQKRGVTVALCAYKLEFLHPVTAEKMVFEVAPTNKAFSVFESIH